MGTTFLFFKKNNFKIHSKTMPKSNGDDDEYQTSSLNDKSWLSTLLGARDSYSAWLLLIVHFNIIAYAGAYWMCQPILPFFSKELGASKIVFGWLNTLFSVAQLVGGPIIGRVCDTSGGARLALNIGMAGGGVSYLLLGSATNVQLLFLSRLPMMVMHAMQAAQVFATVLSPSTTRAAALGRLSLSYGIGMVGGAAFGGRLAENIGYSAVAYAAAIISFSFLIINVLSLPVIKPQKSLKSPENKDLDDKNVTYSTSNANNASNSPNSDSIFNLSAVLELLKIPVIARLLSFQVTLGIALSMYHTVFAASSSEFGFDAKLLGYYQSAGAVIGVVCNTFLVGILSSTLGERFLLIACAATLSACFVAFAFIERDPTSLFLLLLPFGMATSFLYTVCTSALSKAVRSTNAGTSIGLGHGARSLCGIVGPALSGYVIAFGFPSFGAVTAALALIAMFVVHRIILPK